jgi:hypothetical protein
MMARVAALLVIASQLILLWMVVAPSGRSAIAFSFVGHPLVALGVVLGTLALWRRKARERAEAAAARPRAGS